MSEGERFGRWHRAGRVRVSRRRFDPRPAPPEALAALGEHCAAFRPFGSARAELVREAPADLFRGVVGAYGAVKGAPSCLVFVGAEDAAATVGYVGEAAVLEATALGLGTCWVAGLFRAERAGELARVAPGERVFAVSPVGIPAGRKTLEERLMSGIARSRTRKPPEEVARGVGNWPAWAAWAVEAGRLAPSAVNRQPWRFRREGDAVIVCVDGPDTHGIPKRLDCGIAMLHLEAGARLLPRARPLGVSFPSRRRRLSPCRLTAVVSSQFPPAWRAGSPGTSFGGCEPLCGGAPGACPGDAGDARRPPGNVGGGREASSQASCSAAYKALRSSWGTYTATQGNRSAGSLSSKPQPRRGSAAP